MIERRLLAGRFIAFAICALLASALALWPTVARAVTGVTLTAAPPSPALVGTEITLTATPVDGSAAEYAFFARKSTANSWTILRRYDPSNTCAWTPSEPGAYCLKVWAREQGSTAPFEAYAYLPYGVRPPLTSVALTANPPPPFPAGQPIMLRAAANGGLRVEYAFFARLLTSNTWTRLRGYEPSSACGWIPTVPGEYAVRVWARDVGVDPAVYVSATIHYLVVPPVEVRLTADPPSPAIVGTTITLTASSPSTASLEYAFFARKSTANSWTILRRYDPSNTCAWTPSEPGAYCLKVWAREQGSAAAFQGYAYLAYGVKPPLTRVALFANPPSTSPAGAPIGLRAEAYGGLRVEYAFFVRLLTSNTWTRLRGYEPSSACGWIPTVPGEYAVRVWARDVGVDPAVYVSATIHYLVAPPLELHLTADPPSPAIVGTTITLTASSPSTASLEYAFFARKLTAEAWTRLREYQTTPTCAWTPTEPGDCALKVLAREVGSTAPFQGFAYLPYKVLPPLSVRLTADPPSPSAAGTAITLTATATTNSTAPLEYQFLAKRIEATTWIVLQPYGSSNTCSWTPLEPGGYVLKVWVREVGNAAPYQALANLPYLVTPVFRVTLTADPPSPAATGTTVTLTATVTTGAAVQYLFKVGAPTATGWTWTAITAWGTANSCTWTPANAGHYVLVVAARDTATTPMPLAMDAIPYCAYPPNEPPTDVSFVAAGHWTMLTGGGGGGNLLLTVEHGSVVSAPTEGRVIVAPGTLTHVTGFLWGGLVYGDTIVGTAAGRFVTTSDNAAPVSGHWFATWRGTINHDTGAILGAWRAVDSSGGVREGAWSATIASP